MTLDEVKAEREAAPPREVELRDIRDAFRDEAGDIVEVEDVELVRESPSVTTSSAAEPGAKTAESEQPRPGPRARHRFTRGTSDAEHAGDGGALRLVVLRDRRRSRRRKKSTYPPA